MGRFQDYRRLNGTSSRVTRKSKGVAPLTQVLTMVGTQSTGHVITNRKGEMRDPVTARIAPRNLVPMELMFETPEEQFMYIEFCKAAGK